MVACPGRHIRRRERHQAKTRTPVDRPSARRHVRKWLLSLAVSAAVSACAIPLASVTPEGRLVIFGPGDQFGEDGPPASWVTRGLTNDEQRILFFSTTPGRQGKQTPILTASSTVRPFLAVRRTQAQLLATPFLSWDWRVDGHDGETHPVRLIVGFHGGNPTSGSLGSQPFAHLGDPIPPFDRAISIVWRRSALARGSIFTPSGIPAYAARGGLENTNRWWSEAIDLSDIYRRLWPRDELPDVKIMFVGFSVATDPHATKTQISNLILSK